MWIVRDPDGKLMWFADEKPRRHKYGFGGPEIWASKCGYAGLMCSDFFPEVTWETEPLWIRFVPEKYVVSKRLR